MCAGDVRGIGDTRPEVGRGNPGYTIPHDAEDEFAWASLILGTPLLAQRITDILALVQAVRNGMGGADQRVVLAARGRLSVPALFAFAASRDVDSLYLAGSLVSFQNLLETELYTAPLANFAWDLFRYTDLPQLAAQSSPRRIHLAGAVDATNRSMPADGVRKSYPSENVTISAAAAWDYAALQSV